MKIKAIQRYNDKTLNMKVVEIDDEYEVSDDWGNYLIKCGYAIEIKSKRGYQKWNQEQQFTENQTDGNMM